MRAWYILGKANILALMGLNMWYIRTILMLYFLSPLLYVLLTRFSPTRALFAVVILSVIGVLLGGVFGVGTIIAVVTTGPFIQFCLPYGEKFVGLFVKSKRLEAEDALEA